MAEHEEKTPRKVTNIDALEENVDAAAMAFAERWLPMPGFAMDVEVMDARQLRDAMGLRATIDGGDPWPTAERLLLGLGFRWHWLGTARVMYLREKDGWMPDDGWVDATESEELRIKSEG